MKRFILLTCLLLGFIQVHAQSTQSKVFYVNAYKYLKEGEQTKREPLCDGFEVVIDTEKINIGDEYELTILTKNYFDDDKATYYTVTDPSPNKDIAIAFVKVGLDGNGNNYILLHSADEKGEAQYTGGMLFTYWDYVGWYDLWRVMRTKKGYSQQ